MALYVPYIDVQYFKHMQWLKEHAASVCGHFYETNTGKSKRIENLKEEITKAYHLFYDEKGQKKRAMIESVSGCPNPIFSDHDADSIPYKVVRQWKFDLEAKAVSSKLEGLYETREWPADAEHCEQVREVFREIAHDILEPWKGDSMYPKLTREDSSLRDAVEFVFKRTRAKAVKDYLTRGI